MAKTSEDIDTILFRLKLQAKLFMKYKLNLLLIVINILCIRLLVMDF